MNRRITQQDISWFLDLHQKNQLDLNPRYQRRSVWTLKDRKFFLDTIFRNYPCPARFLHKTFDERDINVFHVVDGKQRLETIIKFVENEISIDRDFGDVDLDGKKWEDLQNFSALKKKFWDYILTVEFIDTVDGLVVNEVFDRLNRNARKLERQELRHAKFEGWFITNVEAEAEKDEWEDLKVVTKARIKRMKDVQFISELFIVILKKRIDGFDQDYIDEVYGEYDSIDDIPTFSQEGFFENVEYGKQYILEMKDQNETLDNYLKTFINFYSLWSFIVLNRGQIPPPSDLAAKYLEFMQKVERISTEEEPEKFVETEDSEKFAEPYRYFMNTRGANTDKSQRESRQEALGNSLL